MSEPQTVTVRVPGRPMPWARPTGIHWRRNPTRQLLNRRELTKAIQFAAIEQGAAPFSGPVSLSVEFDFNESVTTITMTEVASEDYRTKRPDVDNLLKQVLEAIEGAGLVTDDAQIARVQAVKLG